MKASLKALSVSVLIALVSAPGSVLAQSDDSWEFALGIYGWFPDVAGTTNFGPGGGQDFRVDVSDVLDNLDFTFQGNFDARKNRWGLFTDVIYLDLGDTQSVTGGRELGPGNRIPVDVNGEIGFDMKSWIWTAAGYYRMLDNDGNSLDLMAGLRYADVEQRLSWDFEGEVGDLPLPGRQGSQKVSADYWDFIVGIRGNLAWGDSGNWYSPYSVDIGTGDSDFTWQGVAGLGYRFGWGNVAAVWRYMDYDLPSDAAISSMEFSGPAVGLVIPF